MEYISQPWPWWVTGILVGFMVPGLLLFGNKHFGLSSSLQHVCAACIPTKAEYFNYDWRAKLWNLVLVGGIVIGGAIGAFVIGHPDEVAIAESTQQDLMELGITDLSGYVPGQIFSWESLGSVTGFIFIILGGFLVGFGTRYANGCTSGHAIMGLSLLSWGSLVATIGFFVGGLITTWLLLPLILQ